MTSVSGLSTGADGAPVPADSAIGDSERVGIRDARSRLSSLVNRAGEGERIVITIGGRPVAQLGPIEADPEQLELDDLVARGLLEAAHRQDRPTTPDLVIDSWTGGRLDRALREVRGS